MNIMNVNRQALSVTEVNRYVKALINADEVLSAVSICGEISNFKRHSAGHLYFTLKDSGGEIAAVMFRGDAVRMNFNPADGMRVIVYGSIDVYEKSGRYQVYVRSMIADGVGAMAIAYEKLKKKLEAEGLFAPERKRPLPRLPEKIGVITAPTGAAIRDILNITGRRYPLAEILIYPSLVQGADAPESLTRGIQYLNAEGSCDVIIIGRGGGSIEDLWAFNDEGLTRAVAASDIPVISAVGHETDFTLCDFAADRRAPTPSAAAEIAVPDISAITSFLEKSEERLTRRALDIVAHRRLTVGRMSETLDARSPEARLGRIREGVSYKSDKLNALMIKRYDKRVAELDRLVQSLTALNPLAVLQRGYGAVKDRDGNIVSRVSDMSVGQRVTLVMADGHAEADIVSLYGKEDQ